MNKESKLNLNASDYAISHCDSGKTYNGLEVHKMLCDAYIAGNNDTLDDKDEKIRKALINVFATHKDYEIFFGVSVKNIIAWLEKQGDQKPTDNTDKVEAKFKVGDWILYSGDHYEGVRHITKINENGYYIERNGLPHGIIPFNHEIYIRLWTIADAKEGDVLVDLCDDYKNPLIFILKKFERVNFGLAQESDYSSYCFLSMSDKPRFKEGYFHHMHDIKPATKEQRDLLFQKMHKAGYTFDFEKKELKKIHFM